MMTIAALRTLDMTVAIATPDTPSPNAMTRTRFRITLTVPDNSSIALADNHPISIRMTPSNIPNVRIVCSMSLILSLLFCPIRLARTAFGPTERPTIRFTKIPTSATQLPTAARALSPANLHNSSHSLYQFRNYLVFLFVYIQIEYHIQDNSDNCCSRGCKTDFGQAGIGLNTHIVCQRKTYK